MGIRASDYPALQAAYLMQLEKEKAGKPVERKIMWLARSSVLKFKPIQSRDPAVFKAMVEAVQKMNPGLTLYIFEIEGI